MNLLNQVELKDKWQTALSPIAQKVNLQDEIYKNFSKDLINTKYEELELLTRDTGIHIGWDKGKVVSIEDKRVYSTQYGSCLAIFMRGYKSEEKTPSYLGSHHVHMNPKDYSNTLNEMINKINGAGIIEIFISGGKSTGKLKRAIVKEVILSLSKEHNKIDFRVLDDTFNIAGDREAYIVDDEDNTYFGTSGLEYAGFDKNLNPIQVVTVSVTAFKKDICTIIESGWL